MIPSVSTEWWQTIFDSNSLKTDASRISVEYILDFHNVGMYYAFKNSGEAEVIGKSLCSGIFSALGGAIVHNVKNINIDYKHIELIAEVCINDLVRLFKNNFVNFVETLNGGDW